MAIALGYVIDAPAASAQGPPPTTNDNRADAQWLTDGQPAAGSTVGATKEPGEANHAGEVGGHSVWFRFYASSASPVVVESCGSSFDTVLAVYGENGQQALAADDDTAGCGPGGR